MIFINMPSKNKKLVEILDKIEKESLKSKVEVAHYLDHNGKVLLRVTGKKQEVTPNLSELQKIKRYGNKIFVTHNHPKPNDSPLTKSDLSVAIYNDLDGVRAMTEQYTYVALRPYSGWGCTWQEFEHVYDNCLKQVRAVLNKKYTTRGRRYYGNLWHNTMDKCCKKLGIEYFKFKN